MKIDYRIAFIFVLSLVSAVSVNAVNPERMDTVLYVTNPSVIVVSESAEGLSVSVDGTASDSLFSTRFVDVYGSDVNVRTRRTVGRDMVACMDGTLLGITAGKGSRWDVVSGGIGIGLVNPLGPDAGDIQWSKSFEISWVNAFAVSYNISRSRISLGIGFDWRNYKTTLSRRMTDNGDGGVEWSGYPEGCIAKNSRVKIFSLGFPLLYKYRIPKSSLSLTLGAVFNLNTYGSLKTQYYRSDGTPVTEFSKSLDRKAFTVDFLGSVGLWEGCGIYVRYSPMKVIRCDHDINFRPLSVGLMLFL